MLGVGGGVGEPPPPWVGWVGVGGGEPPPPVGWVGPTEPGTHTIKGGGPTEPGAPNHTVRAWRAYPMLGGRGGGYPMLGGRGAARAES